MHKKFLLPISFVVAAFLAVIFLTGKADSKGKPGGEPAPCDGSPIEVLNHDQCGESIWIEVRDSASVCDIICWLTSNKRKCPTMVLQIGGFVVVDESAPLGFRFDPNTVRVAEVSAEGDQTSLCFIAEDPAMFANAGHQWYVGADLSDLHEL
jgi:hypothetical protein